MLWLRTGHQQRLMTPTIRPVSREKPPVLPGNCCAIRFEEVWGMYWLQGSVSADSLEPTAG